MCNIYILIAFTETPFSKPVKRNVVYILINYIESRDVTWL